MSKFLEMIKGWTGVVTAAIPAIVSFAFDFALTILNAVQGLGANVKQAYDKVYNAKIKALAWIKKQAWLA